MSKCHLLSCKGIILVMGQMGVEVIREGLLSCVRKFSVWAVKLLTWLAERLLLQFLVIRLEMVTTM
jgi:hypothetical protein